MPTIEVTDDEKSLIEQMRQWSDGVPDDAVGNRKESAVYVSLVSARAELFRMAIMHGHNDLFARHDRLHKLLSPGLVITLCKAWEDLQRRLREDEHDFDEDGNLKPGREVAA